MKKNYPINFYISHEMLIVWCNSQISIQQLYLLIFLWCMVPIAYFLDNARKGEFIFSSFKPVTVLVAWKWRRYVYQIYVLSLLYRGWSHTCEVPNVRGVTTIWEGCYVYLMHINFFFLENGVLKILS